MDLASQFKELGISPKEFKSGQIWVLRDVEVLFPTRPKETIELDKTRMVLIVQSEVHNLDPLYPCVLAAPITTDTQKSRLCVSLDAGNGNLRRDSLLKLGFIQPILKIDLQRKIGDVTEETLLEIQDQLAENFGIA